MKLIPRVLKFHIRLNQPPKTTAAQHPTHQIYPPPLLLRPVRSTSFPFSSATFSRPAMPSAVVPKGQLHKGFAPSMKSLYAARGSIVIGGFVVAPPSFPRGRGVVRIGDLNIAVSFDNIAIRPASINSLVIPPRYLSSPAIRVGFFRHPHPLSLQNTLP